MKHRRWFWKPVVPLGRGRGRRAPRRLAGETLEDRRLLAGGFLAPLPQGFSAAAVGAAGDGAYVVVGQFQEMPALVRVERDAEQVTTELEILAGLPTGDGRGAVGDLTSDASLLVGASQSDRSDPSGGGELTFWDAARQPQGIDGEIFIANDMLHGVSENGLAVGQRLGEPIVASLAAGVSPLPGGAGRADAVTDDGAVIVGAAEGKGVFWTADTGGGYTQRTLELPPTGFPLDRPMDVASDGSWLGGAFFLQDKFDAAPAIWDGAGRLLHAFTAPTDNRGIVVDTDVALVNGIVDQVNFEPATRIFLDGSDGPVLLRSWLADQGIATEALDALQSAHDVSRRTAEGELLIAGSGVVGGQERDFLAVVEDFAIPPPTTAALGDRVWNDADGDGLQEANETAGIAGARVDLLDSSGAVLRTQFTNDQGFYEFLGVAPGRYQLQVHAPDGFRFSPRRVGADERADSDFSAVTGRTDLLTLAAGQLRYDLDAGLTTVAPGPAWQNPDNRLDVDASGLVSVNDLLEVVAEIRRNGQRQLPEPTPEFEPPPYVDADGDHFLSLNDVLEVVGFLRASASAAPSGESEESSAPWIHFAHGWQGRPTDEDK